MPLLVVPLSAADADALTLAEWDALLQCPRVVFEEPDHPLADRLRASGVTIEIGDVPVTEEAGLVLDPRSDRLVDLAKAGARITSGSIPAPDPLTAAHGAYLARSGASSLGRLALVMARLRSTDGCPWDQEQTHASLRVHLLEESYEVLDAIDRGELGEELEEELGDLLLQVAFHAQLAADDGRFDLADVADRIVTKLIHRHPHVFGDRSVADADEVVRNWEAIKKDEKSRSGVFEGLPAGLPALLAAFKVQKRAAALGFQPDLAEATRNLEEALAAEDPDLGRALFWLVAVARSEGIDPEGALREATAEFRASYESP